MYAVIRGDDYVSFHFVEGDAGLRLSFGFCAKINFFFQPFIPFVVSEGDTYQENKSS